MCVCHARVLAARRCRWGSHGSRGLVATPGHHHEWPACTRGRRAQIVTNVCSQTCCSGPLHVQYQAWEFNKEETICKKDRLTYAELCLCISGFGFRVGTFSVLNMPWILHKSTPKRSDRSSEVRSIACKHFKLNVQTLSASSSFLRNYLHYSRLTGETTKKACTCDCHRLRILSV